MYIKDYLKGVIGGLLIGLPLLIISGGNIVVYIISLIFTIPLGIFIKKSIINHDIKVSAKYGSLYEKNLENKPTINVNINDKK